jgi:hypothetical protein
VNGIVVFLAEVAASIAISAFILVRLQHLLRRLGQEACAQGGGSTEFWVAYTQIMMLVAPVLLIAYFSQAGAYGNSVAQMKASFGVVLTGQFIGLALVGRAVWKLIVRPAAETPRERVSILANGSPA